MEDLYRNLSAMLFLNIFLIIIIIVPNYLDGLKKNSNFDALVISMGGSGCTSTIKRVAESHGKSSRLHINIFNNADRLQHASPNYIQTKNPIIKYGIVYVTGNLTNALKSLCRRHFLKYQVGFLAGNKEWIDEQTYIPFPSSSSSVAETRPLFRNKPKHESNEDHNISTKLLASEHPKVLRLRRILAKVGEDGVDPIGLRQHFLKWLEVAKNKSLKHSILFVDMASTTDPNSPTSHALSQFVNATRDVPKKQLYDPNRRKDADVLGLAISGAKSQKEKELVIKGLNLYNQWTVEMKEVDSKLFLSKNV